MSIAFGLPEAIVDGNVERVFSRLFLVEEDIRLSRTKSSGRSRKTGLLI